MRPRDVERAKELDKALINYDKKIRPLYGVRNPRSRAAYIEQVLESLHRIQYVQVLLKRKHSPHRKDPRHLGFDPLKAAILHQERGNFEEACWLIFLFTHFGKHRRAEWRYAREVYGRFSDNKRWDWKSVKKDPKKFRMWLHMNKGRLQREGIPRGFGNHRKYENLNAFSKNGTGEAVETYIKWVGRSHKDLIGTAVKQSNNDPQKAFDLLFRSMEAVARFGRMARFDYLTMLGKLGLAPIRPGFAYMQGATGPVKGARLFFGGRGIEKVSEKEFDMWLVALDTKLKVGMQVLEDSLCNWQKSPKTFRPFRG